MIACSCRVRHQRLRVVLTGGPGAGKTAALELIRHSFCSHVVILPEAAGILFSGGFPRGESENARRATQRAIYYVQRELEIAADALNPAIVLCDRGTVDGAAYWPGPVDFWHGVGTTLDSELARYDAVIHLRTPSSHEYNHQNPLRLESADEARAIDERIAKAWSSHSHKYLIEPSKNFLEKVTAALQVVNALVPACCSGRRPAFQSPEEESCESSSA
jgi:predicted ATPase